MTVYRPSTEMLTSYASGNATPGLALLVRAHAEQSPDSRVALDALESAAGALFSTGPEAAMSSGALDCVLSRLDDESDALISRRELENGPLPRTVIDAVGIDFDAIPWKFRLPGLHEYKLEDYDGESVSLIRARPGVRIPQHTHEGREATLVMTGALRDGETVYRRGDISVNDETDDHQPEIVGDEVCHCLAVMSGSLRYTGFFSRALNYLAE